MNAFRLARAPEPSLNASRLLADQPVTARMPVAVLVAMAVMVAGVWVAKGDLIGP